MKISNYMNNTNSIMEKNTDKVQKGNSQTNEKHTVGQSVKLSISNEGLEYYRNRIQQSGQEKYDDVVQRKELLASKKISDIDYSYEIQKKAAQQNQNVDTEEDLNQFIQYLLFAKKNKQAAKNVLDDFEDTIKKLKYVASSLNVCDNPRLQSLGYRRINFQQHRYFMLYRIENDVVYVDDIFHELQDYENRMI